MVNQFEESISMQASMSGLMSEVSKSLASYLEGVLPPLFSDWWNEAVLNILSFQQQRRAKERGINSLASLDLAALLRVLDQNWYEISIKQGLTSEKRHFVKEMKTIRNRWAHAGSEGFPIDDVYRDLDTLQRFAKVIETDDALLQEIREAKTSLLERDNFSTTPSLITNDEQVQNTHESIIEFNPGQIVVLKSNPDFRGAVVAPIPSQPENRFIVFAEGETQTFYASQLKLEENQDTKFKILPCDEFHAYLTALQIRYPGISTLYSLNAARVDFIPYQFRPVMRFIRSDRPRLLIADGVGVGKTIEAGLILRELQARRDIKSILIICPRPLVTERKWQIEMKRFEQNFIHLDGGTLKLCIREMDLEGTWPDQYQQVIVPYSLFDEALLHGVNSGSKRKRRIGLLDLDPPPRFDLVIVDEAHHIRNQETFRHQAVRFFCDHAEAVVFLTATPIQLGNQDLFVLLNVLRPDLIIDRESFEHMAEPNPFINKAVELVRSQESEWINNVNVALTQAAKTSWGESILRNNPEFNRILKLVDEGNIESEGRVQLITELESLHTFSGIINRTRRRDIGEFTIRNPETVIVEFTPTQKALHDELLQIQSEIFSRLHGNISVGFMMSTIRRQAASCLFGLAPFLEEILNRHLDELLWEEADNTQPVPSSDVVDGIESRIRTILSKAIVLDKSDPKLDTLRKIIIDKQELQNNKIMLFSSFRHTLRYLFKHLKEDGFRVGMIHGGTADEDRVELRNRFELQRNQEDALDVLLFSEIGCEGLDYQFCDCIVNYDLPWNPMRIEQRIGRIDRWGQKSEKVAIINMITPGTVDAEIYERCLVRIGVFNSALGGSEEILGSINREIRNIADNFVLSEIERGDRLKQLADNKIRLVQEQDDLERKQLDLFGIRLPQDQMKREIEEVSSFWLSPSSIYRFVTIYLKLVCKKEQELILGEKALKTLRLSQESRSDILLDFQKLPRQNTPMYREWENWLKGSNPHLLITFESECATKNRNAAFIMPLHPLVKQAAMASDSKRSIFTSLKVCTNIIPSGRYEFAIYQWQFYGVRDDLILRPVAFSEEVTAHLSSLLEKAETDSVDSELAEITPDVLDDLDSQHHKLWSETRDKHRLKTKELVGYRHESLTTSHNARISLLQEQRNQASNEKILRMRDSQIETAEADYARRTQALEIAIERAEVTAKPIAYGFIRVYKDVNNAE